MNQPLVTLDAWTIIFQICNLLLQMYLFKRFLYKPVMNILEKRRSAADEQIRQAKEAKENADAIKAEYEQNMLEAREEANALLQEATATASARSEQILREAQEQSAAMKQKAEASIQQERRRAVNELKDEIGGIAMEIATKVLEREVDEKDHNALIDEFIQNVGDQQ